MKLHIYIFRHGQTYHNRNKVFTGWKNSKLTPLGKTQARKIGKKLARKEFGIAVHSSLSRSRDTLREVMKFQKRKKIRILADKRMRERNYGRLNGLHHTTIIKKYGQKKFDI